MSALTNTFTNIANAIRAKTGGTNQLTPAQMVTEIGTLVYPKIQYKTCNINISGAGQTVSNSVTFDDVPTCIIVYSKSTSNVTGLFFDAVGQYDALTDTWTKLTISSNRLTSSSGVPDGISLSSNKKTITYTRTSPSDSSGPFFHPCTVIGIF